jgi:copper homeostasis protein
MSIEKIILEVCTFTLESALIAEKAGADRIELCENYFEGGTTPSYENIELAKSKLNIPINVMIRPRGGDFLYSDAEFKIMKQDIEKCKSIGVNGVVFGILNTDSSVDEKRCRELVELAKPLAVTFHRAFDHVKEPFVALDAIIACGFDRILTSGLELNAVKGASLLAKLIEKAKDSINIMPGGGVRDDNIAGLMKMTKAKEYHTSAGNLKVDNAELPDDKIHSIDGEIIVKMKKIISEIN